MKAVFTQALAAFLIIALLPFAAEIGVSGSQASAEESEKPQKTRRVPTMSESTFKRLGEAQVFIDEKDFASAKQVPAPITL